MRFSQEVCKAFDKKAAQYNKAAVAQREIGRVLFERLDYLKINPKTILDVGCGTGELTHALFKKYPNAQVIGVDNAKGMIDFAKAKYADIAFIHADMHDLPFSTGKFDLIFSNQVIHWSPNYAKLFGEFHRVMAPQACLMFSTLGSDTFIELRENIQHAYAHTNEFADMHDVGDMLVQAKLCDPVMDMDRLTVHYKSFSDLVYALKAQGVRNMNPKRNAGLTGKATWQRFKDAVSTHKTQAGMLPLSYEVVYGQAWKSEVQHDAQTHETSIALSAIRRMLRG